MSKPTRINTTRALTKSMVLVVALLSCCAFADLAEAQSASLSLTPAVIMAKGTFGQGLTQRLTINNDTPDVFTFDMVAEDVTVKNGKRVFLPAGEEEGSIAATAVFSPQEIIAPPHSSASVEVTLTIPQKTSLRAVVAIFHTKRVMATNQKGVGLTASMGTLMTFNLTEDDAIAADPVQVHLPTDAENLNFDDVLTNTGSEPVVPKGIVAILNGEGKLAGKASFTIQRLLPGEKLTYKAEYSGSLRPGSYRALITFAYEGKTKTEQAAFTIP